MGRKATYKKILEETNSKDDNALFLVVYSFNTPNPPPRFYINLRKMMEEMKIYKISRGHLTCKGTKALEAVVKLLRKFGGEYHVFKVEKYLIC